MGLMNTYDIEVRGTLSVEASSKDGARHEAEGLIRTIAPAGLKVDLTIIQIEKVTDYR